MALKDVQLFITKYLRDFDMRDAVSREGLKKIATDHGLNDEEHDILVEMDLSYLARESSTIREERMEKRVGEFREYFDHLGMFVSAEKYFEEYDAAYRTGLMTRPVELDCTLSFAAMYVVKHQLPPYLIDLARFNYHYTQVSITPIENGEASYRKPDEELQLYHLIQLKAPYRIIDFRYDILSILGSPFDYNNPLYFEESPITLFIQKEWDKATTTQIFYAGEMPLLNQLVKGETSVNELLANYPVKEYESVLETVADLRRRNIISVKLPKYFL